MNKNKLIGFFAIVFAFVIPCSVFAEQITRFGVVDTARVYQSYFRNSAPIRNYEAKKNQFQEEINKRTLEIQELQQKKLEYEKDDNESAAMRVEAEINKKTDFLTEYTNAKNIELETIKNSLIRSDAFYQKLYATLSHVAESEGYSMILSLQQANAILWYSPSVDITDQVIRELGM